MSKVKFLSEFNVKEVLSRKLFLIAFLFIVAFFGTKALFKPGYYTSHDGWHQVVRLYYFDKAVKDGFFPPRYITNLFLGYGYPLFIFSYHLPWILAEPFILVGFSVFDAIKAVYILGFFLSGLTMFFFIKNRFGDIEALVCAFLYLWAPYRFSNIFVRGAIGEATVFIFIPLLFLTIDCLKEKFSWRMIALGALAFGDILISHGIVAFLVLSLSLIYFFYSIIFSKNRIKVFGRFSLLVFFGLALVSYYLVPSIGLKKYTKFEQNIIATQNEGQFAKLSELFYSKWGYGFAVPRSVDSMSFQLGIAQWLTVVMLIFNLIFFRQKLKKKIVKNKDFLISLMIIFFLSIFLITPQSSFFWRNIVDRVFIVDFSWRLLTVAVFASSALAGFLLFILPRSIKLLLVAVLMLVAIYTNRNHLRVNQYTDIPIDLYLASELTTNTYDEYLPKEVDALRIKQINQGGSIFSEGKSKIDGIERKTHSLAFNYQSDFSNSFVVHLFYFPGWEILIDGQKTMIEKDDLGLISFKAPSGSHRVLIRYAGTKLTQISTLFSLITLVFLVLSFF